MNKIRRCCCCRRCSEYDIYNNELEDFIRNRSVIIVDVRSVQEFKEGHIDGAVNIPLGELKGVFPRVVNDKNKCIVVYCTSGIRSKKAQKILNCIGYKNVYNLADGF